LLEGLEIREVDLKGITKTDLLRLESEFYTSKSFSLENYFLGKDIIDFVQYGTSEELNENRDGYPILRLNEFDSYFIGTPSKYSNKISIDTYKDLKLKKDDVLICRTNGNPKYVGKSAIVKEDYEFAYASYLFKIRPKRELINSSTLVAFLNGIYGRLEIEKFSMQSNQSNFSPAKFREIRIPKLSDKLNKIIENFFNNSYIQKNNSQQKYTQAENLLLETLGLQNFTPSLEAVNLKSLKESFLSSGRLDAEYYQPKYEDYINLIKNNNWGFDRLENVCNLKDKNFNPKDDVNYKYIELSNIGKSGEITGNTFDLGKELPSRARRLVNTGDVIISSIEGSLESCALVTEQYNQAICSTGFYVINSEKINSETLLVLFKSALMQNILKQNCSGTILTAINKNEFSNIPVPYIENNIQQQIAELIQESFALKAASEKLLETSKRAVEIAIEENEAAALEFINENSYNYGFKITY